MRQFLLARLAPILGALFAMTAAASAQADPDKPVTPPNSYRIVMENDRVRIIEVHVKAHSKVEVETPPNRERFLYMLSDGALILSQPGKKPYEFALNAGETAVFPAVTPYVENDSDSPVRALMVEVKSGGRVASGEGKRGRFSKRGSRGKFAARSGGKSKSARSSKSSGGKKAKGRSSKKAAMDVPRPPLNLGKANAKPSKRITGKRRNIDG
jgi:quercetin dioxygenase-like cupin family protein